MAEQPETSQPAAEQRRRLFAHGQRRRRRSGGAGGSRLFGRCFLVRDGGAVVQVGVDEALAASDVVDAADRRVSSVRQGETRLLLCDGVDSLVTQISVQNVVACSGDEMSQHECRNRNQKFKEPSNPQNPLVLNADILELKKKLNDVFRHLNKML